MYYGRRNFVSRFAQLAKERSSLAKNAAVAELGVYQGEFASHLARCFPDNRLYLFDTFDGFDESDKLNEPEGSFLHADHFRETSLERVRSRIGGHRHACIRPGWFPDTAEGLDDSFLLVSLDADLYQPMYEGLKFFYPRMVRGGVILLHDYFLSTYPGVAKAVYDFEESIGGPCMTIPVGDDLSVAIMKL